MYIVQNVTVVHVTPRANVNVKMVWSRNDSGKLFSVLESDLMALCLFPEGKGTNRMCPG